MVYSQSKHGLRSVVVNLLIESRYSYESESFTSEELSVVWTKAD